MAETYLVKVVVGVRIKPKEGSTISDVLHDMDYSFTYKGEAGEIVSHEIHEWSSTELFRKHHGND